MFESSPRPFIFAHRGASSHAPENTLAAFELAIQQNADGIELDVKLTADGHVVAIHDATVDRTTGARGRVKDLPLTDLRSLDAGSFFAPNFKAEKIPTLEDVFEAVGRRTLINVELTLYSRQCSRQTSSTLKISSFVNASPPRLNTPASPLSSQL